VKEWSLLRHMNPKQYARPSKKDWSIGKKEKAKRGQTRLVESKSKEETNGSH